MLGLQPAWALRRCCVWDPGTRSLSWTPRPRTHSSRRENLAGHSRLRRAHARTAGDRGATHFSSTTIPVGAGPDAVTINPASSRLVVGNRTSRSLSIINTATFSVVATVPVGGSPELVAIDASDTRVYASLQGASRVDIVDGLTHRVSGSETFVDGPVLNLAVAQFTGRLAVGLQRKVFQVLAPATAVETGRTPRAAAVNPVTRRVYTADIKNNTVTVVDGAANSVIRTIAVPGTPAVVAVDSAAQRVYVAGSGNRRLGIYNGASGADFGKHLATVTTGLTPWAVAADPITHRVWVANLHGSGVTVLNAVTNQKASVPTASEPRAVAMDSTAGRVYVAHGAGNRVTGARHWLQRTAGDGFPGARRVPRRHCRRPAGPSRVCHRRVW